MKISFYRLARNAPSGNEKVWTAKISYARLRLIKRAARKGQKCYGLSKPFQMEGETEMIPINPWEFIIADKGFIKISSPWWNVQKELIY